MRVFAAVVTDGSFTMAAERLGTDQASVSRIVSRMEEKLGAQLLTRSTRKLNVKVTASPRCSVNSTIAAMNLFLAGIGIAQLPCFVAEPYVAEGRTSSGLRGWAEVPAPVHAVHASTRYMDPKVRSFVDLSLNEFTRNGTRRWHAGVLMSALGR